MKIARYLNKKDPNIFSLMYWKSQFYRYELWFIFHNIKKVFLKQLKHLQKKLFYNFTSNKRKCYVVHNFIYIAHVFNDDLNQGRQTQLNPTRYALFFTLNLEFCLCIKRDWVRFVIAICDYTWLWLNNKYK